MHSWHDEWLAAGMIVKNNGSVIKRQFRWCLTKPCFKPFSILPTVISKHYLLLTVTRRLASQTRKLFIYLKLTTYEQISRPTDCLKPWPKLDPVSITGPLRPTFYVAKPQEQRCRDKDPSIRYKYVPCKTKVRFGLFVKKCVVFRYNASSVSQADRWLLALQQSEKTFKRKLSNS